MNYGEVKAAIVSRSHRTDLAALIPSFIQLAEAEYNRRVDTLYDLTSGADTVSNDLSETSADVYIFGGLMQLAVHTNDDAALQKYTALFERALDQAHYAEVRQSGVFDETATVDAALVSTSYNILEG